MNLASLLDQFVGSQMGGQANDARRDAQNGAPASQGTDLTALLGQFTEGKAGGFAGGLATGGLLGVLMGNKKARKGMKKMAGGAVGYGGSAVLGALALKAYQNWSANRQGGAAAQVPGQSTVPALPAPEKFDPAINQARGGQPMQMVLVKAMIAAANADGHIDASEQKAVFDAVDHMQLGSDEKALVFDVLRNPPGIREIAGYADGIEQASEIYLASRLAIDPDEPVEQRYLAHMAEALSLPEGLASEIDAQVAAQTGTGTGADGATAGSPPPRSGSL